MNLSTEFQGTPATFNEVVEVGRGPKVAKVALITDAASAVGSVLTLAMAAEGWDVALQYDQAAVPAGVLELVNECIALGRRAAAVHCNMTDEASVKLLVPRVIDTFGKLTCIVNTATLAIDDCSDDFSATNLARHMHTNVSLPILLAYALHAATPVGAQGVVITLLDHRPVSPQAKFLSYTLSKAALQSATRSLALALAPTIRVVGIAPVLALTQAKAPSGTSGTPASADDPTLDAATSAEDFAASVCFIADCSAVTGATLQIDSGKYLRAHAPDLTVAVELTRHFQDANNRKQSHK
ncbi:SDR family oxidoreductase [Glaciimonas immobilis]|uniref:NAD(P)-dependent dehydrogenase (Short-subunit alcohol dehydrogenase family) n=1 Tax=Glaciimonas immobilis TaxID=728004 RepID=A0A840RZ86_9BURK|nr:SDR family oxidoreductase [Glaciimonas immobilis]KAF3995962.1 SDR family oxidoreductase [Glaciimonas immobilis]MBB5202428.1 NAD(P)-dependent dehydrogenase (short-subunit alcohol dehydrogenase family) [Glaciimonas immobilis]